MRDIRAPDDSANRLAIAGVHLAAGALFVAIGAVSWERTPAAFGYLLAGLTAFTALRGLILLLQADKTLSVPVRMILLLRAPRPDRVDAAQFLMPDETQISRVVVSLDGSHPPQTVLLAMRRDATFGVVSRLTVIGWNSTQRRWTTLGGGDLANYDAPAKLDVVDLFGPGKQLLLSTSAGSGCYLSYRIYALRDRVLQLLLQRDGLFQGTVRVDHQRLIEISGSIAREWTWDGSRFAFRELPVAPPVTDENLVVVTYSISDAKVVHVPATVTLRVGQALALLRSRGGPGDRILGDGRLFAIRDGNWVATLPGRGEFNIIPNGYDWDHAAKLLVTVVSRD